MAKNILEPQYDRNGEIAGHVFTPSAAMRLFVIERAKNHNFAKTASEICESINLSANTVELWQRNYGDHFLKWYQKSLEDQGKDIRKTLEHIGLEKALEGEFPFWLAMAKTFGVVANEAIEHKVSVTKLVSAMDTMSDEELKAYQQKLLKQTRGIEQEEEPVLIEAKPIEQ